MNFMKKIINLLLLLNCILLLGACIDDKGNYTYQDKDEVLPIQISRIGKRYNHTSR